MPSPYPSHIVVTGASGALGSAVTQHLLEAGTRLALIDRVDVPSAGRGGTGATAKPVFMKADVTDADSMKGACRQILAEFQHIDAVVRLAGGFEMGAPVHELGRVTWDRMMDLNVWSFVAVTQAFVPAMLARGSGRLVGVSARVASRGVANMAAMSRPKAPCNGLPKPWPPSSRLTSRSAPLRRASWTPPVNRRAMPLGDPREWVPTQAVADVIALLLSPAGQRLNGQHLEMN